MVVRLFSRHIVFACILILAVVIGITMAVNFNRGQMVSAAAQAVSSSSRIQPENRLSSGKNGSLQTVSMATSDAVPSDSAASRTTSAQSATGVSCGIETVQKTSASLTSSEMRAVWVPYLSLNMSRENDKSEQAFQKKFHSIVSTAKSCGMNTLIVQVRPFGDALYPSSYFPWSHVVGGTQGVNPGYDPLKDMVSDCHSAGMKIHAWINPLRIQISGVPSILATENTYYKWKGTSSKEDYVVDYNNGKYYNPAYEEVRTLIADGAKEIVKNYDVDGIQFDDYFYPTQSTDFDKTAYDAYCKQAKQSGSPLSQQDWRRANINALVSQVYQAIKSDKKNVSFGIAPQGNVQNDWNMGADVQTWCSVQGYLDYICPQLYYNFDNPTLPFDKAAKRWKDLAKNKNLKLYFGLAAYKAHSDADSGTWKKSSDILFNQVQYGRKISCDGFMFYSCDYLTGDQTQEEIQNVIKLFH